MNKNFDMELQKQEQIARGKRITEIRENELRLNKTDLAKNIGISSQFLGLVERGKGNLSYRSVRLLRDLSGHSSDYILYGLDDEVISSTRNLLAKYSQEDIINALRVLGDLSFLLKDSDAS